MTAPINIEQIFPSFELLSAGNNPDSDATADAASILDATQATGTATLTSEAVSEVAVDNAGSFFTTNPIVTVEAPNGGVSAQTNSTGTFTFSGIPANGRKVTVDGTDITFGDVASGAGDIKTDIVGTSLVPEITAVAASATITIVDDTAAGMASGTVTVDGNILSEAAAGDWQAGTGNSNTATSLASAIDLIAGISASSSGAVITITDDTVGVAGNARTLVKSMNDSGMTISGGTFANGVDFVAEIPAGDAKDDLAASTAQYIRANIADFSAEAAGAVVTVSYTGSNGTNSASPIGNTKTISTDAGVIATSSGTLTAGAVEKRTAVVTAQLYADTDATNRGTIETFTVVDGGSGYDAVPTITLPLPNGNTIEKIGKLGADMVSGGGTFDYAKDYIAIALEDFNINNSSGVLKNPLSSTESAEGAGDFRKLVYHILRKANEYLSIQESVDSVSVTNGGTGYVATDTVSIIGGGGEGATANIVLNSGVITDITITNAGSGYTSTPSALITTSTGSSAVLDVVLSTNTPEKFSVTKGFLSENATTNEVTREYTTSFTFDEAGLEMAAES